MSDSLRSFHQRSSGFAQFARCTESRTHVSRMLRRYARHDRGWLKTRRSIKACEFPGAYTAVKRRTTEVDLCGEFAQLRLANRTARAKRIAALHKNFLCAAATRLFAD